MRRKSPGLFSGWWTDLEGKRIRKILRGEYGDLYYYHRICKKYERLDKEKA